MIEIAEPSRKLESAPKHVIDDEIPCINVRLLK